MKIAPRAISRRTRYRDSKRSAGELDALLLARELDQLSLRFPRFSRPINCLTHRVRFQLLSLSEKQKLIRRALMRFDLMGFEELVDETGLDNPAMIESLSPMVACKEVELCLRDGTAYRPTTGAPTDALGRQVNSLNRAVSIPIYFRLRSRE